MASALIIDDDLEVGDTLALVLEEAGYTAFIATSANAGTEAFQDRCPDIVLADLSARAVDGVDRIRAIHSIDPSARIIAMTGDLLAERGSFFEDARRIGAMALLPKPFEADELLSMVGSCLAVSGAASPHSESGLAALP